MFEPVTWGQLKEKIENSGATDDTKIKWIDIHQPYDIDEIDVFIDDDEVSVS